MIGPGMLYVATPIAIPVAVAALSELPPGGQWAMLAGLWLWAIIWTGTASRRGDAARRIRRRARR